MASKAIGNLVIMFGANLGGLEKSLKKAQKSLNRFGRSWKRTGDNLTQSITLPTLIAGGAAVKLASDYEESLNKVDVSFGATSQSVRDFAKTTTQQFGIAEGDALEMAALFGDMGTSMGIAQGDAARMSTQLVGLAGDLASFKNIGIEQAQTALAGVFTGETESLKKLGIVMTQDTLLNFAKLELGINKSWKEMSQAEKVNLRLAYVMKSSANATGDFARTSDSFANQLRIMQGEAKDLGVQFGMILMPLAKEFISKLRGLVSWFKSLSTEQKESIVKWTLIAAAVGPLISIVGRLSLGLGRLAGAFSKLSKFILANPYITLAVAVGALVTKLVLARSANVRLKDSMYEVNQASRDAKKAIIGETIEIEKHTGVLKDDNATLANKEIALNELKRIAPQFYGQIALATLDIQDLDGATQDYIKTLEAQAKAMAIKDMLVDIQKKILDARNEITETVTDAPSVLDMIIGGPLAGERFNRRINASTKKLQNLENKSKNLANQLKILNKQTQTNTNTNIDNSGSVDEIIDKYDRLSNSSGSSNKNTKESNNILGELFETVKGSVPSMTQLAEAFTNVGATVGEAAKKIREEFLEKQEGYQERAKGLIKAQKDSLKTEKELEIDAVNEKYKELLEADKKYALDVVALTKAKNKELEAIEDRYTVTLQEHIAEAAQMMADGFSRGADSFAEYGDQIKKTIKDVIGAMIAKGVTAAVTNAMEGMAAFPGSVFLIPMIAGLAAGLARTAFNSLIPSFAQGGIVSSPMLAMVGDSPTGPEAIIPLSKLDKMMGNQTIQVVGKISGNDIYLSNARAEHNKVFRGT